MLLGQIQKLCKGYSYSCYHVSVILNCPGKVIKFPVKSKSKLSSEKQIIMRRENARLYSYSCFHDSEILNSPGKVDKFPVESRSKLSPENQITMRRENISMHADLIIFIAATFSGDTAGRGAAG